jgi:hypothetical protein
MGQNREQELPDEMEKEVKREERNSMYGRWRKSLSLGTLGKGLLVISIAVMLALFAACKVSDDASAAAQQMAATSAALTKYYDAIADSLTDTIALNELNESLLGVPFGDADRKQIEAARAEILKRRDLAQALTRLSTSFGTLTGSKASTDVATAATALGNELITVKALPGGSPVPSALGKAGDFLIQLIQQYQEKNAAQGMDGTMKALVELFKKEQQVYDSLARQHIMLASQVAKPLIDRRAVDPTPLLQPALKPFGLSANHADTQIEDTLRTLAKSRLAATANGATKQEEEASAAMLKALEEMSSRIDLLATEKPMLLRTNPLSLKVVESWAASLI